MAGAGGDPVGPRLFALLENPAVTHGCVLEPIQTRLDSPETPQRGHLAEYVAVAALLDTNQHLYAPIARLLNRNHPVDGAIEATDVQQLVDATFTDELCAYLRRWSAELTPVAADADRSSLCDQDPRIPAGISRKVFSMHVRNVVARLYNLLIGVAAPDDTTVSWPLSWGGPTATACSALPAEELPPRQYALWGVDSMGAPAHFVSFQGAVQGRLTDMPLAVVFDRAQCMGV